MQKICLTFVALIAFCSVSNAQINGGFVGPNANQAAHITIKEALNMGDEAKVVLQGNIVNSLGDEKYTFRDETGDIVVEIDDEDWRGINVTPENVLEISGEVDKDFMETPKIDVDVVTLKK